MHFQKFYKNFILCGVVDQYCLLCDEIFHKLDDIEKHIRWEKHRKAIKSQTCLPKFKNDGIFKVGSNYYCEHCNYVVKNITSVKDHVASEKHIANKTSPEERYDNKFTYNSGTVTYNNIKIDCAQWHSVFNKKCLLCNIDVENITRHIENQDHVVKVIQAENVCEGDDKFYRKLNKDTFQCFTCKKTFAADQYDEHWKNDDHTAKGRTETPHVNGNGVGPIKIYNFSEYDQISTKEYSIEKLAGIDDDFFIVDVKNDEILCKKCKIGVKNTCHDLGHHLMNKHEMYDTKKSKIITHIYKEMEKEYIFIMEKDHGKARHELAIYGREHNIKLNAGGSKGYCFLCDRFLSAHINIFKQHVNGAVHTGHLEIREQLKPKKHKKGPSKTETLLRFAQHLEYISKLDVFAINSTTCIDRHSFLLLKPVGHGPKKQIKCFACENIFDKSAEKGHIESRDHRNKVMAAKVILEKHNFVREIRPKLYHCGICNVTSPFWDTLERHIADINHKTKITMKYYVYVLTTYEKQHGSLPCARKVERSTNTDIMYDNILHVLSNKTECHCSHE